MKITNKVLASIVLLLLTGCFSNNGEKNNQHSYEDKVVDSAYAVIKPEDVQKFKDEYESVNGTISKKGQPFISVSIPDDSRIIYATAEDVVNLENGIVLFGFPTCAWCRNALEPLLEFAKEEKVNIHYVNIREIRDEKELKDGKIVTIKEGTVGYQAVLEKFHELLKPYPGLNEDSIKRITSPTVIYITDNKPTHIVTGTVSSQEDPYTKLSQEQFAELKQLYKNPICGCDE